MKTFMIGAVAITTLLLSTTAMATQPPAPTPTPTNVQGQTQGQGQAQGQIQGQAQGQGQLQSLKNQIYNGGVVGNSSSTSGGGAGGAATSSATTSQGQQTNISNVGNQYSQYPVSSSIAPSFAIGGCQWAISAGAQFLTVGASFGGAGMYEFCKPIMKAKHFYDIGKPGVAKNLECNYSEFKEAYRMAGEPCRNDMSKAEIAAADAQATTALSAPPAVGPCGPRGVARTTTQRDGSQLITCN